MEEIEHQQSSKPLQSKRLHRTESGSIVEVASIKDPAQSEADINIQTVVSSRNVSSVWQFAERSEDRKYAICRLCQKQISISNGSTSAIRRHLTTIHKKPDLIMKKKHKDDKHSTIDIEYKEKLDQLSTEAIINDCLPFNAFMKPGLSKLIRKMVPGEC